LEFQTVPSGRSGASWERDWRSNAGDGQESGGGPIDAVGERVSEVGDRVGRTAEQVGRKVGEVPYQAKTAARSLTEQASELVRTNPLGASVAAVAVGTVIGMMLPATPAEHRIMGQASERLIEQAGEAATQQLRTVGSDSSQGRQEDSLG
jgi:ElaB/YqjD/DUF883 family membrane-anchored ribosome-binding protein